LLWILLALFGGDDAQDESYDEYEASSLPLL